MDDPNGGALPSLEDLLVWGRLYAKYRVSPFDLRTSQLRCFSGIVNAYCVGCRQSSVFRGENEPIPFCPPYGAQTGMVSPPPARPSDEVFPVRLVCARDKAHVMWVVFHYGDSILAKVGQHPSLADMLLPALDRYSSVLSDEKRREFGTAIGLHAHDVGIGAFVYLRRVFESVVEEVHTQAMAEPDWDEALYQGSRMVERIGQLGDRLPKALRQNASVYGILSKGIHELSDDECGQYFEIVRTAVELILDETIEKDQRERKQNVLRAELGRVKGELKAPHRDTET